MRVVAPDQAARMGFAGRLLKTKCRSVSPGSITRGGLLLGELPFTERCLAGFDGGAFEFDKMHRLIQPGAGELGSIGPCFLRRYPPLGSLPAGCFRSSQMRLAL